MPPAQQTAEAFIAAINAQDLISLRALMTDDHTFVDSLGRRFSGAEAMLSGWQHFFHAYPGYRIDIHQTFAAETQAALFGEASGGWRIGETVSTKRWKVAAAWLAEIQSGKVRTWSVFCDTGWANPPQP